MRIFVIKNSGTKISDDDARLILQAQRQQFVRVCAAWRREEPQLVYHLDFTGAYESVDVIDFGDMPPQGEDGVLGEHTEAGDIPEGVVYAGYELANGGSVFAPGPNGEASVASTFSHEAIEQFFNPFVNLIASGPFTAPDGSLYDCGFFEMCDGGESGFEIENVTKPDGSVVNVYLSNWLKPTYWDPQYMGSDVDAAGQLSKPLTVAQGGYSSFFNITGPDAGNIHTVFGEKMPEYRRRMKLAKAKSRWGARVK